MDLKELQQHWNKFGETDPFWAILTDEQKSGNRWDPEDFFRTGRQEIDRSMDEISTLVPSLARRRALDFGCGVGRLTQALARHFQQVDGVDIAPSMIELAQKFNQFGDRCRYHLNAADNLRIFGDASFDFVYSVIVLQHMESRFALNYLAEFARILVPGGVMMFQIPDVAHKEPPRAIPMADAACRAKIEVGTKALSAATNRLLSVPVRVTNISEKTWIPSRECMLRVGNHWLDKNGGMFCHDDGRADLPGPLKPGESVSINLKVTTPAAPQTYVLEVDMLQEYVGWFRDKGSLSALVVANISSAPQDDQTFEPAMEMYGTTPEEVKQALARSGCDIIHTSQDQVCGPDWKSMRYIARKR